MSRDPHDPLAALSGSMDDLRLSSSESEAIWAEVLRRSVVPANDLSLEPVALPTVFGLSRMRERSRSWRASRWLGLAAGVFIGVATTRALQAVGSWEGKQAASLGPESLTAAQGEMLVEYFDVFDAICDVSPTELACGPTVVHSDVDQASDSRNSSSQLAHDGRAAFRRGDLNEARKLLEAALRVSPADSGALTSLGRVAAEQSKPAEAEDLFRQALAIDSRNAFALVNLATLLNLRRDYHEAAVLVRRAAAADPSLTRAREMMRRIEHLSEEPASEKSTHQVEVGPRSEKP